MQVTTGIPEPFPLSGARAVPPPLIPTPVPCQGLWPAGPRLPFPHCPPRSQHLRYLWAVLRPPPLCTLLFFFFFFILPCPAGLQVCPCLPPALAGEAGSARGPRLCPHGLIPGRMGNSPVPLPGHSLKGQGLGGP